MQNEHRHAVHWPDWSLSRVRESGPASLRSKYNSLRTYEHRGTDSEICGHEF